MRFIVNFILTLLPLFILFSKDVYALNLAEQTQGWTNQLNVWQAVQELGSDLNGKLGSFTFRVSTSSPNLQQFNYTAQNSRIYDKTTNSLVAQGCASGDTGNTLRGLSFHTEDVPQGYEDVTIDFSCNNYTFISGHRYLISVSNANMLGWKGMILGTAAYGQGGSYANDFFSLGGLRYGNGNQFDWYYGSGKCDPIKYIWGDITKHPVSGCNIWTTTQDDFYFVLSDTDYQPPITPTPTPTPKTPVVFIPGIGGSEFKSNQTFTSNIKDCGLDPTLSYKTDDVVWVDATKAALSMCDDYFDVLKLKIDGQTPEYPQIVLNNKIFQGSYENTIKFFTDNGYELDKTLFLFSYDWRKDINLTITPLDELISSIKQQTGSSKVDIVAHSMGGLVAKNYINDTNQAQNVRKLVTLGAPYLGATEFIKRLLYGACLTKPGVPTHPLCLGLTFSEVKDIMQNMLGGFELSPTKKYFDFYNNSDKLHPYPFRDDRDVDDNKVTGPLNYDQIKTLLTNLGHNTALFTPAETFHNLDNNLAENNSVDVSIVAGSGQATLGQIIEKYAFNFAGIKIPHKDLLKINGDETVPLFSASLNDPTTNLSLTGPAKVYYTKQTHGNLVANGPAMELVKNILNNDSSLPTGVSNQPYSFNGDLVSVHSPVNIHAYDETGNHTGPTGSGDFEANIPGSSYDTLDDAKFIWLPDTGKYTIKFEATGEGSFDFKIRKFNDNINNQTILYQDIPLTSSTKAETVFDTTSSNEPVLQVDSDGNGITDFQTSLTSTLVGDASYDQTPPTTSVKADGTLGSNNWYKSDMLVTLTSDDQGGAGIDKIEYSLDSGQTVQIYSEPFTISSEGINKLKVKSTDKAGNEEEPQILEIKIDKTAPEAKVLFNLTSQNLEIHGIDNLTDVQIINPLDGEFILTDQAGNNTKLQVEPKEKKKKDKLELKNISYNSNPKIYFPENELETKFEPDKKTGSVKEFKQSVEIKKQIKIETNYQAKKGQTKLEIKKASSKEQKEIRTGILLLQLLTNQGKLEVKY